METLKTDITVALFTIKPATRHQFGGRGVSRRREPVATAMVADHIALPICRNHRFSEDGEQLEPNRVQAYLMTTLTALPDALVQAYAGKSQLERHPAAEEICRVLLDKLTSKWTVVYIEPDLRSHSSPGLNRDF